jgi:hypothetical protein
MTISGIFFLTAKNSFVYIAERSRGIDNFKSIISASEAIDSFYPNHIYKDFRLWFRADKNYDTFFSLAAVYLYPWGSSIDDPISSKKPHDKLTLSRRDIIQPGDQIVILSSDSDSGTILVEASQALIDQGLKVTLEKSEAVQTSTIRFYLYFTKAIDSKSP